jgi:hypothetical protein
MGSWIVNETRRAILIGAGVTALVALAASRADAAETLTVPLSSKGEPAALDAALVMGSIHVVAGPAGQVVVDVVDRGEDEDDDGDADVDADVDLDPDRGVVAGRARDKDRDRDEDRDRDDDRDEDADGRYAGMKRLPNRSVDLVAEEEGNRVRVRSGSPGRPVHLRIAVPAGSSVRLSTVNGGGLEVEGIQGELELHNTNGPIRVRGARGPVTANTVNGDVEVVFTAGAATAPMAFSTLNGDVDITLPPGIQANLRLHTDHGEIYSDFDVDLSTEAPRVEQRSGGRYRVALAKELRGKIGAGGPELFLKTFNGDIVLRRAE